MTTQRHATVQTFLITMVALTACSITQQVRPVAHAARVTKDLCAPSEGMDSAVMLNVCAPTSMPATLLRV